MVEADLNRMARRLGGKPDLSALVDLFLQRLKDPKIRVPRALESNFDEAETPQARDIHDAIAQFRGQQEQEWQAGLFAQRKRLADAERTLAVKPTKKALSDRDISTRKVAWYQDKLRGLHSTEPRPEDSRIFPMWFAPVIVMEAGEMIIRPMRYHLRPNGKPAAFDRQFDGTYNARRDSLGKFWKPLFGRRHAVLVASSFYENVALHNFERRELRADEKPSNVVLHFNPRQAEPMLVACLWDRWQRPGEPDLLSFAAITDEPPDEVAATGHDRCIVPLKPENVRQWLEPEKSSLEQLQSLLDDRQRPYYEHRLAA